MVISVLILFFDVIILLVDINECFVSLSICPGGQQCANTDGSFTCSCASGLELINGSCQGRISLIFSVEVFVEKATSFRSSFHSYCICRSNCFAYFRIDNIKRIYSSSDFIVCSNGCEQHSDANVGCSVAFSYSHSNSLQADSLHAGSRRGGERRSL